MSHSHLVLAVAGSRKTQGIVEACAAAARDEAILVLTYTTANQAELRSRLAAFAGDRTDIAVLGWFSFLIGFFVRPYVPFLFIGTRVRGFDFDSLPQQGTRNDCKARYFTSAGAVRRVHLAQLAFFVEQSSNGAGIRRLKRLYKKIYVDEVQDMCGYDLEILRLLMASGMDIEMVGDVRQAVLVTNEREQKNSAYKYMKVWDWFRLQEKKGLLSISQESRTWRCRPEIAEFADGLFGSEWGFDKTTSLNDVVTGHDGLFLVHPANVPAYIAEHKPVFLRYNRSSGSNLPYEFSNFRISKGKAWPRVLILPTAPIANLLRSGLALKPQQAADLYVAVTRAQQSVAFVLETPGVCGIPYWNG
jgi:DNA helicase II / ATP-dependent DNA helicase PcrA